MDLLRGSIRHVGDKKVLLNGEWLSDSLINAGQQQSVDYSMSLLVHTLAFEVKQEGFVQVLHNGGGHWVTISTLGCRNAVVEVFDSMCPVLTSALDWQIATLLCPPRTPSQSGTLMHVHSVCTHYLNYLPFTYAGTCNANNKMGLKIVAILH